MQVLMLRLLNAFFIEFLNPGYYAGVFYAQRFIDGGCLVVIRIKLHP
jgi:hypothetical protein